MLPSRAIELAERLMLQFGLTDWRIELDNAKRRFGRCCYGPKVISLSKPLIIENGRPEVADVIRHEIAHALTPGAKHGYAWKLKAMECGARPERCYDSEDVNPAPHNWSATCAVCGKKAYRTKRPRIGRRQSCGKCSRKFDPNNVLVWVQQGKNHDTK